MRHTTSQPVNDLLASEPDQSQCNSSDSRLHVIIEEEIDVKLTDFAQNTSAPAAANTTLDDMKQLYRIVIPILLLACLLSFLSNLLIVCSARWIRRRRLSPNLLLSLSLAGADAFASLVVGLGLVLNSLLPVALNFRLGSGSHCLLLALEALRLGSLVSTALHLLALAANHHVGISNPLHYVRIVTRRTTLVSAFAIWVCPIVFFFIYFSSVPNDGFQSTNCSNFDFLIHMPFRVTTGVLFFIPLIAMTFIYTHIFTIVRRHQPQNNSSSDIRLRRNIRAAVTTLLILGAYVFGWMPAVLYFVLTCVDCPAPFTEIPINVRVPIGVFANAMIVARCLVDPALYLIRMPDIRDALLDMFGIQTMSRNNSNPSSLQNTQTDMRRLTLVTSQRKLNVYANGRNAIMFERKEIML